MYEILSTNAESREIWQSIPASDILCVLLGGTPPNFDFNSMVPIWCIASEWIHQVYIRTIEDRTGIG